MSENRVSQEGAKSSQKSVDGALDALFSVISEYNGVVRRIIEMIEPVKGKWSTRKSVQQSTIGYFAAVLKQLNEPLTHLVFQLNKVNNPILASTTYMLEQLKKIIDQSPPFRLLDTSVYKTGYYNTEGFKPGISMMDPSGRLAILRLKKAELIRAFENTEDERRYKIDAASTKEEKNKLRKIFKTRVDAANEILQDLNERIKLVKKAIKNNTPITELPDTNDEEILNKAEEFSDETNFNAPSFAVAEVPVTTGNKVYNKPPELTEESQQQIAEQENSGVSSAISPDVATEQKTNDGSTVPNKELLEQKKNEIRENLQHIQTQLKNTELMYPQAFRDGPVDIAALNGLNPEAAKTYQKNTNENNRLQDELRTLIKSVGMGYGFPLADLLANPKQQYNSMQRPISNDDSINNDMIKANNNWQVFSNPPHDVPIGNLNPFLAKPEAQRYSYESELRKNNSVIHPEKNALGADISLLQGPITNISGSGASKKKPKALEKIEAVAIDEKNDMFKKTPIAENGMIQEEKEDQFKFPELRPKKEKSGRRR